MNLGVRPVDRGAAHGQEAAVLAAQEEVQVHDAAVPFGHGKLPPR
jgi:hypothetical protein